MDRRKFIKTTSLLTIPLLLKSCNWNYESHSYSIEVNSDASTGHLLMKSGSFKRVTIPAIEVLVVGGGIAGTTAAYKLRDKNIMLCELSENLGGTSSANQYNNTVFSQGAHYDLAYPKNYGKEVLEMLEELKVITYQPWNEAWGFVDQQHIITHRRKNKSYRDGVFSKDVLEEGELKDQFLTLINEFLGKMLLPTRIIPKELHYLNDIDFISYLSQHLTLTPEFIRGLDYHMKDDYGANANEVSALAGIHYFMCRPYYKEIVELFSPPEGNNYFINKLTAILLNNQLLTKHLVKSLTPTASGFEVEIIDIENQIIKVVNTEKVIYAGQKHALKYIYPDEFSSFEENKYAPWMVVNVVIDNKLHNIGYWQNEMLTSDTTFMGFVDSNTQHSKDSKHRVLTAYYCLPQESRKDLINTVDNKSKIAEITLQHINNYFQKDITPLVNKVFIKAMGHAMPIPAPGYLLNDKHDSQTNKNIAFAGVDSGRLPLLYEAIDSGIEAVKRVFGTNH